ncbi:MAG: hypothetical protein WDO74_23670 [Pseudomonadota bacterium]
MLQLRRLRQRAQLWVLVELRGAEEKFSRLPRDATGNADGMLDGEAWLSVLRRKRTLVLAMLQDYC